MKIFHSAILLFSLLAPLSYATTSAPTNLNGGWVLDWNDEFDGDSLDTSKWNYDTGLSNTGTAHCYTEDAVSVRDGELIITSRYEDTVNPHYDPNGATWQTTTETQPYSSGAVNTRGTQDFLYGRIEVRAKVQDVTGIWPAIWLLGDVPGNTWSSPKCGEIDILEHVSQDAGLVQSAFHWGENGTMKLSSEHYAYQMNTADYFGTFHTYTLEWNEGGAKVFVDGTLFATFDSDVADYPNGEENPFRRPQYLILNTAIGGAATWPEQANPSEYPAEFAIDYVRYYVQADAPEKATLRYAYDFNDYDKSTFELEIGANLADYEGSSTISNLRDGQWLNAKFPGMAKSVSGHAIHSGALGFVGADALNISFEDGFTVASNFKFSGTSSTVEDTLVSFKINEQAFAVSYNIAQKGFLISTIKGSTLVESEIIGFESLVDSDEAWFTFILSGQSIDGDTALTLSFYTTGEDASLLGSTTIRGFNASDILGDFSFSNAATPELGGVAKDASDTPLLGYVVDNLAIYEGAASAQEWLHIASSLGTGSFVQIALPEPSTATLSLLALTGLLLRRRR